MELLTLSTKEIRRLEVLQALDAGAFPQADAARLLGISVRQVKRLLRAYRAAGAAALASTRRGRRPNNAFKADLKADVLDLYIRHYHDFGPTLASEKLLARHGIMVNHETLRRWLIAAGLWQRRRRRAAPKPPRERRACFGELVQCDGSPHDWFEERGARCTLLLAIDDATSRIGAALFAPAETTNAYFSLFARYFTRHGLPDAVYTDRHSIFRINTALTRDRQTQIARALDELDIELICANSPQAKGRVERANRTMQDRLVKELRLRNISTIADANEFLPQFIDEHNARFAKLPASDFNAHRSTAPFDLQRILAQRFVRALSRNLTFQIGSNIYAAGSTEPALCPGMHIDLHLTGEGRMLASRRGKPLPYHLVSRIEKNAPIVNAKDLTGPRTKPRDMPQMARTPAQNHPWKIPARRLQRDIAELQIGDITALR